MTSAAACPWSPAQRISCPRSRRRAAGVGLATLIAAASANQASGQVYAHRTLIPVPLDDTTRSLGFLPAIGYFADIQRSSGSAGDDRAWGLRLAATAEVWRIDRRTTLLALAADEVAANALKDGGFNPRGIAWELAFAAVRRFGGVDWQLGFVHLCRHEIDNSDDPALQTTPPDYVPRKRTMSANGPRTALILRPATLGSVLGRRVQIRAAIAGETYRHRWDGRRAPDTTAAMALNSWKRAQGAASGALRVDAAIWRRSTVFVRAAGTSVFFGAAPGYPVTPGLHANSRVEAGLRLPGGAGALELYIATERVFDDVMTPEPRPSHMRGIGIRVSELNHF